MTNTKLTKKEKFAMVLEIVKGNEMLEEFIKHEIELLNKKSGKSGETKTQKENKELKNQLVVALAEFDKPLTVSEFMAQSTHAVATLSNQKLSALLRQLVEEKRVVKTSEKKKSYFAVATETSTQE